ncbi:sensory box histidine kinase PhoR [Streptomyces albiaxialis]|uniref:histidine kinase n=1 Tax=Streptomyces albiaxialis TaxID=329523 RepID=A0ABN2VWA9_9ACTN
MSAAPPAQASENASAGPCHTGSLRAKMTASGIVMLAIGIVVATCISLMGVQHYLVSSIDAKLKSAREQIGRVELTVEDVKAFASMAGMRDALNPNVAEATDTDPTVFAPVDRRGRPMRMLGHEPSAKQRALARAVEEPLDLVRNPEPVDLRPDGDTPYRATAVRLADGQIVLMATEVGAVGEIMHKVLRLELFVGVALMAGLGTAMFYVARRRLRPMEDMVETASAIAEGCEKQGAAGGGAGIDLSRRVAAGRGGKHTRVLEVERLRLALNAMLHQVEAAFLTREHATAHLRRFVADASHELRTPLAAIRGYLQLYERGMLRDEEERARALARMTAETERMARLVDELLALARLDQRPELRPCPVDVARLAEEALADLAAQQPDREIVFDRPGGTDGADGPDGADGAVLALADEPVLRQVVGNLVSNVRVHTPVGAAVRVSVHTGPDPAHAGHDICVLRVQDEGPGMRPEDAARVFDRFFRTDGASSEGSGLGMSVVKAGVEAQGGEVHVTTAPNAGFRATVTLPAPPR